MNGLTREQYSEVVRIVRQLVQESPVLLGTVCAVDKDSRTMKVILEPYNAETGWCRTAEGAFCEEIGTEVLVSTIRGENSDQYIVTHIIDWVP